MPRYMYLPSEVAGYARYALNLDLYEPLQPEPLTHDPRTFHPES